MKLSKISTFYTTFPCTCVLSILLTLMFTNVLVYRLLISNIQLYITSTICHSVQLKINTSRKKLRKSNDEEIITDGSEQVINMIKSIVVCTEHGDEFENNEEKNEKRKIFLKMS